MYLETVNCSTKCIGAILAMTGGLMFHRSTERYVGIQRGKKIPLKHQSNRKE